MRPIENEQQNCENCVNCHPPTSYNLELVFVVDPSKQFGEVAEYDDTKTKHIATDETR